MLAGAVAPGRDELTVDRLAALRRLAQRAPIPGPRLARTLKTVGYLIALLLLAAIAWRGRAALDPQRLRPGYLAAAFAAGLASWLALAGGWVALSQADQRAAAARMWVRTQLLRYLPGGFWAPAARARSSSPRLRKGVALVVAENLLLLLAAGLVGSAVLGAVYDRWWLWAAVGSAGLLAGLLSVAPRTGLHRPAVLTAFGCYLLGFLAFASEAWAAQAAVGPVSRPWVIFGAACLAWMVGLLVLTAPGGLGAREAAYVAILATVMPAGRLAAGALTARMTAVAAELVCLAVLALPPLLARFARSVLRPRARQPFGQAHPAAESELAGPRGVHPDGRHLAAARSDVVGG